jgi:hypothetical protein
MEISLVIERILEELMNPIIIIPERKQDVTRFLGLGRVIEESLFGILQYLLIHIAGIPGLLVKIKHALHFPGFKVR